MRPNDSEGPKRAAAALAQEQPQQSRAETAVELVLISGTPRSSGDKTVVLSREAEDAAGQGDQWHAARRAARTAVIAGRSRTMRIIGGPAEGRAAAAPDLRWSGTVRRRPFTDPYVCGPGHVFGVPVPAGKVMTSVGGAGGGR